MNKIIYDFNSSRHKKVLYLFITIIIAFLVFLYTMFTLSFEKRRLPYLVKEYSSKAQRGDILSKDGFHLATTQKLYKAIVNTNYINQKKKELFIGLFSIYSGVDKKTISKKLRDKKGVVTLSYSIPTKKAQYLKTLSYELLRHKVFIPKKGSLSGIIQGLSIIESGEKRVYPYGKLFTPIIGHQNKFEDNKYTKTIGVKGIEKYFNEELLNTQDYFLKGRRDVGGYVILDKSSSSVVKLNGDSIMLTMPASFQLKIESMLDEMKIKFNAKEVMISIMNSKTGEVLSLASSNRFNIKDIKNGDYSNLNSSVVEYSFEPGSVMKPIVLALLLDKNLVQLHELINTHNGSYKIAGHTITDEHKAPFLSAQNVIIHSSNVGISIMAQRLSAYDFYNGLKKFGFSKKSTYDLRYERVGVIPKISMLNTKRIKASASYGYGLKANLMQLTRAYSAFNNNGVIVYPKLIDSIISHKGKINKKMYKENYTLLKRSTADKVKATLIKTVKQGTGKKADVQGLIIGGKTGTAKIVEKGKYVNKYNTTFIGFANDQNEKYTIGVVVIKPESSIFAAQTSTKVFKNAVQLMVSSGYLRPD